MKTSKIVVLVIILLIFGGVFAWSWVNFTQSPPYNPEVAHGYVQHFDRRCKLEVEDEEICRTVIGAHHRRCFEETLQDTPEDQIEEHGPILYSRPAYMACMRAEIDRILMAQ